MLHVDRMRGVASRVRLTRTFILPQRFRWRKGLVLASSRLGRRKKSRYVHDPPLLSRSGSVLHAVDHVNTAFLDGS
jgi:hypothetical protein